LDLVSSAGLCVSCAMNILSTHHTQPITKMLSFPNAKINLGLYITEKRTDGYHNLLTCFLPIPWNDVLEIVPAETVAFKQTGLTIPGNPEDNLCVKAYRLLQKDFDLPPVLIHLHKIVPMGAGLGGGSSDAAFVLKNLNVQFALGLSETQLEVYAAQLGSDCAFFVRNRPAIATGRGEVLNDFPPNFKGLYLVVVYPAVHVSTAEAYGGVKPRPFEGDFTMLLSQPTRWKDELHNQFEETIFPKYPILAEIKQQLYDQGAWYAAMSGSGSAVFGLFKEKVDIKIRDFDVHFGVL
jgi:4-diphosphocytidyl-2-C-methyl-D-erythritol kinase